MKARRKVAAPSSDHSAIQTSPSRTSVGGSIRVRGFADVQDQGRHLRACRLREMSIDGSRGPRGRRPIKPPFGDSLAPRQWGRSVGTMPVILAKDDIRARRTLSLCAADAVHDAVVLLIASR